MVVLLVHTVVSEMRNLLKESHRKSNRKARGNSSSETRSSTIACAPPPNTLEGKKRTVPQMIADPARVYGGHDATGLNADEKREKVKNAIANQKFLFQSKLKGRRTDNVGDDEVMLVDDEPQLEERRVQQIQKAVDILETIGKAGKGNKG